MINTLTDADRLYIHDSSTDYLRDELRYACANDIDYRKAISEELIARAAIRKARRERSEMMRLAINSQ